MDMGVDMLSNLHAEIRIIQTKVQGLMRNAGMRPKLLVLAWLACGYALASAAAQPELASGRLVIGAEDDAAPWSYADGTGYVNDVVRAAFQRSGWQVQYMVMPYARCKAMVLSGKLIACFSASKTPDLASQLLYPRQPVFNASNVLIARANTDLQGCNPAEWPRPVKVGRVASYEYRANVMALFGSPQVQVDDNNSEVSNIRKLEAGHIDAALVTLDAVKRLEALAIQAHSKGSFRTVCDFGPEGAYIVFSRQHPGARHALQAFESGYAGLLREGAIAEMQHRWQGHPLDQLKAKPH